ncbi:serine/threonine-protein kinase [Euzebya tangerina]|uniref:serine/threonine-protein kinase n=1 Tax=Euzebya tangerina TaxID=591198 RepID=UPI0013C331B5|nr:serine/threonine-protein kinase [Euzebya tangerina]
MTRIADYRVLEPLGNGSHGQVHKAFPPERLGMGTELVALKVFDRSTDYAEYQRVVEEVQVYAAAANQSDELANMFDVGRHGERLFISMAYYPEGSLAARARGLTKKQVVQLVASAARGAHALHEAGVVHREIKPTNILLADTEHGVLSDLGLAHVVSPGQTVTGLGVSSLETMEPGLVRGEKSARASDIWSLGACLHWGLTGLGVFADLPDSSLIAVLRHIMTASPRIADDGIPPPIREVLARCLDQDRMERYGTALELADDLQTIVEGIGR